MSISDNDIRAAIADMKAEILADIAAGIVPNDVPDFSALHDYVDANEYGGFCDDSRRATWGADETAINRAQAAVALWLIERRKLTATHLAATGGPINDTETIVSWLPGSSTVDVHVKELPGLMYWSCPNADVLRRWVDELIKPNGFKRDGARMEVNSYFSGWKFQYSVKPV